MEKGLKIALILIIIIIAGCLNMGENSEEKYSPEIRLLIKNLGNENRKTVLEAQEKLLETGEDAIPALIEALGNKNSLIRGNAAYTLGLTDNERAVKPLIEALKDENKVVRLWTITALGKLKKPESVSALIFTLNDEDKMIRAFSARALGMIKTEKAGEALEKALENELNPSVREIIEKILKEGRKRPIPT